MSHIKKHTTKEKLTIHKNVLAQLFVAIENVSKRVDSIDSFLTKSTKDFKEDA